LLTLSASLFLANLSVFLRRTLSFAYVALLKPRALITCLITNCKSKIGMIYSSDSFLFIHVFAPFGGDAIPDGRDAGEQDLLVMSVATEHFAQVDHASPRLGYLAPKSTLGLLYIIQTVNERIFLITQIMCPSRFKLWLRPPQLEAVTNRTDVNLPTRVCKNPANLRWFALVVRLHSLSARYYFIRIEYLHHLTIRCEFLHTTTSRVLF
jgi:hypothetical protein